MNAPLTPELSQELAKRIRLVRRDLTDLLVHFTRGIEPRLVEVQIPGCEDRVVSGSAREVLRKILRDGKLIGTTAWAKHEPVICFSEAPIQEFRSICDLASIATSDEQKPRYEPFGVAVSKKWLFQKGGRPVIYDNDKAFSAYSPEQQYRLVPFDPTNECDYTWEREWRIKGEELYLDPLQTLVIVPTASEAFDIVTEFSDTRVVKNEENDYETLSERVWLAVSLDIFG